MKGLTKEHWEWINETVDNHKRIRSETQKARVKLLMMAAMMCALEDTPLQENISNK